MGTYVIIENKEGRFEQLKTIFDKHYALNKDQFRNDFGDLNQFLDIFEIYDPKQKLFRLKVGVMERRFYTPEFIQDIKDLLKEEYKEV